MIEGPVKVAFVHDWLVARGGAEALLGAMLKNWPQAPIYTLVHDAQGPTRLIVDGHPVVTSFLQKLPQATRRYRSFLPLAPYAIEQFDLSGFDLVVSVSFAVAKGVLTGPRQLHVCMCCSPIRYAWDLQHQYLRETHLDRGFKSVFARWLLHYIRLWDTRTAHGVDEFVAISDFIARRIRKVYGRQATVIYPPVDVEDFPLHTQKEDFYLTASRMVPYKRMDLIVEAFAAMRHRKLIVIGDGPEFKKIQKLSRSHPNIQLLGYQPTEVLRHHMQRARAFIFAAEEDFGIVPLEAQACGTPVIAYGAGASLETLVDGETAVFFDQQSVPSLQAAIDRFEDASTRFDPSELRRNAERFSEDRFQCEFRDFVERAWKTSRSPGGS